MDAKMIALMGGKKISVSFANPAEAALEITVRQIPIVDYERGLKMADDEIALVGFLCGRDKPWSVSLAPESYEEILAEGKLINEKGFFSFCRRRMEAEERKAAEVIKMAASLPPEVLQIALQNGVGRSTSPTSSQPVKPRLERA